MAANYQHLRAFHAIAIEGGISRAARRLNVSQPTLSQQLKALERRHGVALFESRKLPLQLTTEGRELFVLTTKLFATAADIEEVLDGRACLAGGLLRLGADNPSYAALIVDRFRRDNPATQIKVRMGNAREVMLWLAEAEIDAALASDPPADAAFHYEPLADDALIGAMPLNHAWTRLECVPLELFASETLLLREPTSKTRALMERALGDVGVMPKAVLELHSRETIRECISLGLGVTMFFSSECPPDSRIAYRPISFGRRGYELRSYLVCQSERRRSDLLRALQSAVATFRASPRR